MSTADRGRMQGLAVARDAEPLELTPRVRSCGVMRARGRYAYPPHRHANYEVLMLRRGRYACSLNGCALALAPGEVLVVAPGDEHQDDCHGPLELFCVAFAFRGLAAGQPRLFAAGVEPTQQIARPDPARVEPLVAAILAEGHRAERYAAHVQDGLFAAWFWNLVRGLPPAALDPRFAASSERSAVAAALQRCFRHHVEQRLDVPALARLLGLSERGLRQRCAQLLGESPARAFQRIKLERACSLLRDPVMTLREIAERLGFADEYHFSKVFKRRYGCAPSHWRERV